ncbi:26_t:CDS:10 [Entrophospora sp. SA101]|nr:26_t:CDS:10 [Entrophospora sp. SA101]
MENQRIISTDKGSTTTATKRTIESAEQLTPTSPEMSMVKTKKSAIEEAAARLRTFGMRMLSNNLKKANVICNNLIKSVLITFNELGNQNIYVNINNNNNNKITNDSNGNNTNSSSKYGHYDEYIKTMIQSIKELELYDSFKYAFLDNSKKFFREKSLSYRPLIENRNIGTYLKLIKQQIEFEIDKVTYFFGEDLYIRESSAKIMINEYYLRHMDIIIEKGIHLRGRLANLVLLYDICKTIDSIDFLDIFFKKYINNIYNSRIIFSPQKSLIINKENLETLSQLNKKFKNIQSNEKHSNIVNMWNKNFMSFVNEKKDNITNFCVDYIDHLIITPSDNTKSEKTDEILEITSLIVLLDGDDLYLDNLNAMIKDIHESIEIKKDFDIFNHLKVTILTGSYWPNFITGSSSGVVDLKIPYELFLMRKSFQDYYYCKGKDRNLKWLHSYDNLIISSIHPKRLNLSDAIFINENLNYIESTVDNPIIIAERKSQKQVSTSEDVQTSSYNISNEIRIDSRIMKLMKLHKRYQQNSLISFIQKDFKNNFHQQIQIKSLIKRQFLRIEGKNVIYELSSIERICFQIEQAHWFYEDFVREQNPSLPSFTLKHEKAFGDFMKYKIRVPVCGAIMLNSTMDKVLLVKGWSSRSGWGFPKGKINKDELDSICAAREVFEETGYDITPLIKEKDFVEITIRGQRIRLYIVVGVLEATEFCPQTRKEISVEWHNLSDLPTWSKNRNKESPFNCGGGCVKYGSSRYYMVVPRLRKWVLARNNPKRKNKNNNANNSNKAGRSKAKADLYYTKKSKSKPATSTRNTTISSSSNTSEKPKYELINVNTKLNLRFLPISVQPNRRILISKLDPDQSSFNHNAPVGPYEPAIFDYNKRINVTNQNNNTTTRATISIDDKVLVPSLVDNDLETQRKNSLLSILQPTKSIASSSSNAAAVINKQLENHNKNIEYIHQINSSSNSNPLYNKILQSPSLYNNSNNINSYYNNNNIYYNNNNHALLLNPMTIPHPIQDTSANNALYEEIKAQERQLLDWITTQI